MGRNDRMILVSTFAAMAACVALSLACKGKDDEEGPSVEAAWSGEQVEAGEFEESDEDLLTVDYGEFYDELEPFGTWVEVNPRKIGLKVKKETALRQAPLLDRLFAVPAAHADVTASFSVGAVYVWQPDASLAVGAVASSGATAGAEAGVAVEVEAEAPAVEYTPYENGQWEHTDAG
ncbi:MAG: hypothetical protein JRG91_19680, partial [Deltaproteobacteria bacterium]|nr:hypothetical protein [Deltaproteobacteria bacterium]